MRLGCTPRTTNILVSRRSFALSGQLEMLDILLMVDFLGMVYILGTVDILCTVDMQYITTLLAMG
jgi:hypothetical protein